MRQQVNLYQPTLTKKGAFVSARNVGVGLGMLTAALCAHSVWNYTRLAGLTQTVMELRTHQAAQLAQLEEAARTNSDPSFATALETRIRTLQASVDERRRALQVLRSGAAGRTAGFAPRLEALARRSVEGLWIDSVVLSASDGAMTLRGGALDVDAVPTWLLGLAHEPALAGARFDNFVIERPKLASSATEHDAPAPKATAPIRFSVGRGAPPSSGSEAPT